MATRTMTNKSKTKKTPKTASHRSPRRRESELDLVMQLMGIRGKSCEESDVAAFIQGKLVAAGANAADIKFDTAHKKTPTPGSVGNMIWKLPGTISAPRRLLMAHMDTVPICEGSQPKQAGGRITSADKNTGLGADDRAGVAVVLNTALRILREQPAHPPLTFLWTVQEEIGLFGARYITKSLLGRPGLAFNWDGGSPAKVTVGATGGYRMSIHIDGIASHAGNAPENGVSAIAIASLAIADLQSNGWHGLIQKNGKRGTTNIGIIQGGKATNVVTDKAYLRAEARSHDPAFRKIIVGQIEKAFQHAAREIQNKQGKRGKVRIEGQLDYESFRLADDEPCVRTAQAAIRECGEDPILFVTNGGVDANWMTVHGIPTVTMGCGQVNPHMITEALNIAEFKTACRVGWHIATKAEV